MCIQRVTDDVGNTLVEL